MRGRVLLVLRIKRQRRLSSVRRARSWATFTAGELMSAAVGTVRRCRLSGFMAHYRPNAHRVKLWKRKLQKRGRG